MMKVNWDEIKVGDLLAPDPDVFMMGDRWIVEKIDDEFAEMQIYHCGVRLPKNNWYSCKISRKESGFNFWTREETLESWINYYTSDEKRREYYEASLKQVQDMESTV